MFDTDEVTPSAPFNVVAALDKAHRDVRMWKWLASTMGLGAACFIISTVLLATHATDQAREEVRALDDARDAVDVARSAYERRFVMPRITAADGIIVTPGATMGLNLAEPGRLLVEDRAGVCIVDWHAFAP